MLVVNPLVVIAEYFSRFQKFWFQDRNAFFWLLLTIPIMISFHSTVHEGTHALAARVNSKSFPKVIPFLMDFRGSFQNGITIGDLSSQETVKERDDCNARNPPVDNTRLAGWIGWPEVVALLITVVLALIFLFVNVTNPVLGLLLRAWFIAATVDFLSNTGKVLFGSCNDTKDWWRVMIRGDYGSKGFWVFTLLLWLIIFSHFVWVWRAKWATEPLPDRGFWGYRWAAFVLGLLSLMSMIFYFLVRDDGIDYGGFWYIFGLIMQLAAFFFYWIYYGLSLKHEQE